MLKIFKYLKRNEWLLILVSIVFIVTQVWLDLKLPDYMAEITTLIQTEGTGTSELVVPGLYMLLCAIGSMVAAVIVGFFAAKVAAGLSMRLRGMVFDKTLSFSMEESNVSISNFRNRSSRILSPLDIDSQIIALFQEFNVFCIKSRSSLFPSIGKKEIIGISSRETFSLPASLTGLPFSFLKSFISPGLIFPIAS